MIQKHADRICKGYGIALGIMLGITGICLMAACLKIYLGGYRVGEDLFSREAVALAFGDIALPCYVCLGMLVIGLLLNCFLPEGKQKRIAVRQSAVMLRRLHATADMENCAPGLRSDILQQQKLRNTCKWITGAVMIVSGAVFLLYALNGSHFHPSEINSSMIRAICVLLPCLLVSFAAGVFCVYYCAKSMDKEIVLLKQVDKTGAKQSDAVKHRNYLPYLRWAVLAVGIIILIYGFISGGTQDVLTKAVNICTECIGLG